MPSGGMPFGGMGGPGGMPGMGGGMGGGIPGGVDMNSLFSDPELLTMMQVSSYVTIIA